MTIPRPPSSWPQCITLSSFSVSLNISPIDGRYGLNPAKRGDDCTPENHEEESAPDPWSRGDSDWPDEGVAMVSEDELLVSSNRAV